MLFPMPLFSVAGQNGFHNCPRNDDLTPGRYLIPPSSGLTPHLGFHLPGLLKLIRRAVSQSRVQPLLVIDFLQKIRNPLLHILRRPVFLQVDFFMLERLHEALRCRVVIGIALAGHADLHLRSP